ncbi:GFA family protein [Pelagibacterales bacterium SAG-MED31]|nr:GFA family protein [Pelagibacterales bacterium SAG-MED31]
MYNLKCHCGSVELEVETDLQTIKQCNCSICIRKNAKMCMVSRDSVQIIKGKENLTSYKFNTKIAEHFFCKTCGIYTHHNRRSDPNGAAINIGCIDEINSFDYEAEFIDMKNK